MINLFGCPGTDRKLFRKITAIIAGRLIGNELWIEVDASETLPPFWFPRLICIIEDKKSNVRCAAQVRTMVKRNRSRYLIETSPFDPVAPELEFLSVNATITLSLQNEMIRVPLHSLTRAAT